MDEDGSFNNPRLVTRPNEWFSHVAIVRTDVKRSDFPTQEAYVAEMECIERAKQVAELLSRFHLRTSIIPANDQLAEQLQELRPDLCLNFVDTLHGSGALASGIPGIFNLLNIPFVGSGTLALSLNNNKYLTKSILEAWDIPTPQYQLLRSPSQELEYDLRFPLIVKLNEEHGSVGISNHSVVTNLKQLKEQVTFLIETYHQPVLVEEFIESGIELTAVVLESTQVRVLLAQRDFEVGDYHFKLLTFETKWATNLGQEEPVSYSLPKAIERTVVAKIKQDLRTAFEILRMDDVGRFDIMLDKYHNYYVVDCNANPALGPVTSVAYTAQANNLKFETILSNILRRNYLDLHQQS